MIIHVACFASVKFLGCLLQIIYTFKFHFKSLEKLYTQQLCMISRVNCLCACMKCILNNCGGWISLHCNFWHVIFDVWTRDIGCVARELDWKLVTSKITSWTDVNICMLRWRSVFISLFADFGEENICFLHVFSPRLLT